MAQTSEEFIWALKNGDMEAVKNVVEKDSSKANVKMANGRMPLHLAADYGQEEVIEYLLSKGSNINEPDQYNITPLLSAIYEGHTSCVKALLKKGANKNGKAPDGSSYIDCAESEDIKQLLK